MTIGEKLRNTRIDLNLSQAELAEKAGISERSIYNYEQTNTFPKRAILEKLADALNVTINCLLDVGESDMQRDIDLKPFYEMAKKDFGSKGEREAQEVVNKASALFAGGDLDDKAKEVFFQSLLEVYLESKAEARQKFSPKRRIKRKK